MEEIYERIELGLRNHIIGKQIYHYKKLKSTQSLVISSAEIILRMKREPSSSLINKMKERGRVKKNGVLR